MDQGLDPVHAESLLAMRRSGNSEHWVAFTHASYAQIAPAPTLGCIEQIQTPEQQRDAAAH
ncbi:hypothetical protein Pve01_73000 [Planomonospora venezuelensis]|nr:hypothetical protein Pve01_73000 [Planomonospora venezuelensis]